MSDGTEVLLLHRVGTLAEDAPEPERALTVTPGRLERALTDRADRARPAPAELRGCRGGLLVTCDDAHRSFVDHVLPLLELHRVHAILFVTTAFASGELAPYELRLAHWLAAHERDADYRELREPLRGATARQRERALAELGAVERPPREQFLGWQELRELARHPLVTIGAHGRSHTLLSAQRPWQAWREIHGSRRELRRRLDVPVDWFAYPYGGQRAITRRLVALAGYRGAFTTREAALAPQDERFAMPRIEVRA